MAKKRKVHPIADGDYQKRKVEEYDLCRAPKCRNIIAKWARGSGYCTPCRKKRL